MRYSVSTDVPTLDDGLKFHRNALGLVEVQRPIPAYVCPTGMTIGGVVLNELDLEDLV
jgi:hypothetical protein